MQCGDEMMLGRILDLNDGFLLRAAHMTEEAVRLRFRQCPDAFYCLVSRAHGDDRAVGYFILLPLNRDCCGALRAGSITAGRQIQLSDLAKTGEEIVGVYLSVVCAIGQSAHSAAIFAVITALRDLYSTRNVRYLFVRAATEAGAHMLGRLSGTKFEADGRIHEIDMAQYNLIASPQ
jgi:hypothetical protein